MINFKNLFNQKNILLLIISCVSIVISGLPLTNVTGYEFSATIAIFASILAGVRIISYRKKMTSLLRLRIY
jgi:hypothetical protein